METRNPKNLTRLPIYTLTLCLLAAPASAQQVGINMSGPSGASVGATTNAATPQSASVGVSGPSGASAGVNANTGITSNSTIGNGNQTAEDVGVAVNGTADNSNVNNNQNNLSTGNNTNQNIINPTINSQPVMYNPSQSSGGSGGSSALVMPRNPLSIPNASLGRKNFGIQLGVQNNPGLSALTGGESALGWFMQAGLNIPFGKIPEPYNQRAGREMDEMRRRRMENERDVFGNIVSSQGRTRNARTNVEGKVVGMSAYNYSAVPKGKVKLPDSVSAIQGITARQQPKVLALKPSEVFTRPLDTGKKMGLVEAGEEYPYLGHTRSGWVKLMMPDGKEGWAKSEFEYIKFDYTQVDDITTPELVSNADKNKGTVR